MCRNLKVISNYMVGRIRIHNNMIFQIKVVTVLGSRRLNFLFSRHPIIREKALEKKKRLSRKPSQIWKAILHSTGKAISDMASGMLSLIDLVILNDITCLFLGFQVIQSSKENPQYGRPTWVVWSTHLSISYLYSSKTDMHD